MSRLCYITGKKNWEHEGGSNRCAQYSSEKIDTVTGELRNKRTSGDHPNYNIVDIGRNTKKTPGDLRRLAVTQTAVRSHQLMLV